MSTIVVVKKGNLACIAADTLTCFGPKKQLAHFVLSPNKIMQIGESYVGVLGNPAHQIVLESVTSASPEQPRFSGKLEIFEWFRKLHPRLKEDYYLNPKDDDNDPYESSQMDLLIANRSGIFGCMSLREVYEYSRFWAIGSGASFALGAMHAVYDQDLSAERIAQIAVNAAIEFDDGSGAPITSNTVKLDPRKNS